MTIEAQGRFTKGMDDLIEYFAREFDMTYAEMIGCLQMKVFDLCYQCPSEEGDEEDGNDFEEGAE